ncbi:uncharacterized protein LOC111274515 [Durio zibethinus]|uniref:Uncharacterized protein LOC111274515 n=1 Tax=Durio zibethinus TaxID=66656 RepID=A0A6P5WGC5_DURZI|nr:uncharacterized protein LOC111274515 [Durio zibethinus]
MNSTSSYTSSTDSEEIDSSTIENSSSSQRSISKNSGAGHSTSWRSMYGSSVVSSPDKSSIESPLERTGIIRRFSTSMVPSKTAMLSTKLDRTSSRKNVPVLKDFTETTEMPNLTKVRRVSFNDSVETVPSAKIVLTKSVEGVPDNKEIVTLVTGHRSRMKAGLQVQSALAGEKHEFPSSEISLAKPDQSSDSNRRSVDEDDIDARKVSRIVNALPEGELHSSISNAVSNENKMDTLTKPPMFAVFFFIFVLLLYILHLSARIY